MELVIDSNIYKTMNDRIGFKKIRYGFLLILLLVVPHTLFAVIPSFENSVSHLYLKSLNDIIYEFEGEYTEKYIFEVSLENNFNTKIIREFININLYVFWYFQDETDLYNELIKGNGLLNLNQAYRIIKSGLENGGLAFKYIPGIEFLVSELFEMDLKNIKIGNFIVFSKSEEILKLVSESYSFMDEPDKTVILNHEDFDSIFEVKNAYDFINLETKKKDMSRNNTVKSEEISDKVKDFRNYSKINFYSSSVFQKLDEYLYILSGEKQWLDFIRLIADNAEYFVIVENTDITKIIFYCDKCADIIRNSFEEWNLKPENDTYTLYDDIDFFIFIEENRIIFSNYRTPDYNDSNGNISENILEDFDKMIYKKNLLECGILSSEGKYTLYSTFNEGNLEKTVYRFYNKQMEVNEK